jgi:hypothetical protein
MLIVGVPSDLIVALLLCFLSFLSVEPLSAVAVAILVLWLDGLRLGLLSISSVGLLDGLLL